MPRPPRRRLALLLLLALPPACGGDRETLVWARGSTIGRLVAERVDASGASGTPATMVDLGALPPFRWERLFVFGPGTPPAAVRDSLGFAWPGAARGGAQLGDSAHLVIFSAAGEVLAATSLPRRLVDFAPETADRGYTPAEARFRVERTATGQARLVR